MHLFTENPVLQKEIRGRLRGRRQSRSARIGSSIAIGAVVALFYYYCLTYLLTDHQASATSLFSFCSTGIELTLLLFMMPSLGAASITQEREQQTWNALLLSRLTPGEIVIGKFIATTIPGLIMLAVFFPLTLFAALVGEIAMYRYLGVCLLLLLTLCFCTAISLFWSWSCRRTYIATASAFGSVAFLAIGTFILYGLFALTRSGSGYPTPESFPLLWINPYFAMGTFTDSGGKPHTEIGFLCCVIYALGTIGLLTLVVHRLSRGPRELEQ